MKVFIPSFFVLLYFSYIKGLIVNYQLSINSPSIPRFLMQIYGGKKHPLYNNNQPLEAPKTATLRHVKPL